MVSTLGLVHVPGRVRRAHQINPEQNALPHTTSSRRVRHTHQHQAGLSYIEVIVATVLISISLVPAMQALNDGVLTSHLHTEIAIDHYRLVSKMEQTLALPYAQLLEQADALVPPAEIIPPPYSDPAGTAARRLVMLKRYDADNADSDDDPFSGTDDGLLWVQVNIENSPNTLETLLRE